MAGDRRADHRDCRHLRLRRAAAGNNKRYAARNTRVPSLLQGLAACSACGYGIDVEVVSKDPPPAFPRRNIAQTRGQDMDCIREATGWPANRGSCVAEGWTCGTPTAWAFFSIVPRPARLAQAPLFHRMSIKLQ